MKREQVLSSGVLIRQDFSDAVRPIFFQTEYKDWLYATNGGTLFIIRFRGRLYALTCKHVFRKFEPSPIFITQQKQAKKGSMPAPVSSLYFPSSPTGDAVETDVVDMCAIEFADDIPADFFGDSPYIFDERTIGTAEVGHRLRVSGVLKDHSDLIDLAMGYCNLELQDVGASPDPVLRQAKAKFTNPAITSVVGVSGSPVFDETSNVLCGMAARGGMVGSDCTIRYIDIFDIAQFLNGISTGASQAFYKKQVLPVRAAQLSLKQKMVQP
jgi:hypothetical protein